MTKKKPGMMIYFEDYEALRSTLCAQEFVQLMDAMTAYAANGELPDEEALPAAALICWRFMQPKLRRDEEAYCAKKRARSQAAKKRWEMEAALHAEKEEASECEEPISEALDDPAEHERDMQMMQMHDSMPTSTSTSTPTSTPASAPSSKTAAASAAFSAASQEDERIEALISRYRMPATGASRNALAEDLKNVGFEKVEAALEKASLSNSREMISINFYRRFLSELPPRKQKDSILDQYVWL